MGYWLLCLLWFFSLSLCGFLTVQARQTDEESQVTEQMLRYPRYTHSVFVVLWAFSLLRSRQQLKRARAGL